MNYKMC